jgi:hypothetical protein
MDPVTGVYVALMAIGVLWIILRIVIYLRIQRQRGFLWDSLAYDEQFLSYLEGLKSQEKSKSSPAVTEQSAAEAESRLTKSEGASEKG